MTRHKRPDGCRLHTVSNPGKEGEGKGCWMPPQVKSDSLGAFFSLLYNYACLCLDALSAINRPRLHFHTLVRSAFGDVLDVVSGGEGVYCV